MTLHATQSCPCHVSPAPLRSSLPCPLATHTPVPLSIHRTNVQDHTDVHAAGHAIPVAETRPQHELLLLQRLDPRCPHRLPAPLCLPCTLSSRCCGQHARTLRDMSPLLIASLCAKQTSQQTALPAPEYWEEVGCGGSLFH